MIKTKKDIYIIKNTVNDKVYIGQAQNSAERWVRHLSDAKLRPKTVIAQAIHKYGQDKFYYQILEPQVENYNERERYWINYFQSIVPNGYNVALGGESIGSGIDNPVSSIRDSRTLDAIISDLSQSKCSCSKLARKYGCSEWTIWAINNGKAYRSDKYSYPIRKANRYSAEKIKQLRYSLKYELDKTIADLAREYNMDKGEISNINQGHTHKLDCESYPLRKGKAFNPSTRFVSKIIALLKTDMPQKDIARKFNVSVNCISQINTGKSYHQDGEHYPIRSNYQLCPPKRCFSPNEIREIETALKIGRDSMRTLAQKFECTITTIMNINNGVIKKYRRQDVKYPLRPFCNDYPRIAE